MNMNSVSSQPIIIPQAFYSGATLATAIATALDLSGLPATGKPFAVAYDTNSNKFSITPAAGNIKLFATNTSTTVRRDSTAANLIGFTIDSSHTTPIESDTAVYALGTETVVVSGTSSTTQNVVSTDTLAMTTDNQLVIKASAGTQSNSSSSSSSVSESIVVTYEVVYRVLD